MIRRLSDIQLAVASDFFTLKESEGFVIHGGFALIVLGVTSRETEDIDFFTSRSAEAVRVAASSFERHAVGRGWETKRQIDAESFIRMTVVGEGSSTTVDFGYDSAPLFDPKLTPHGPVLREREQLGRKLCAVFNRTEPRDFSDLFALVHVYSKEQALQTARKIDLGLDQAVLAQMMRRIEQIPDEKFPTPGPLGSVLKDFYATWADELE